MPITIARKTARTRVNLKTRKKRGNKTTHSIIVKQPVAKSFVSNIGIVLPFLPFQRASIMDYNRSSLMKKGMIAVPLSNSKDLALRCPCAKKAADFNSAAFGM
jgi:hypothetical protein